MANRDPEATKERILAAAVARVLGQGHLRRPRRRHRGPRQGQQADALLLLRVEGGPVPRDPAPPAAERYGALRAAPSPIPTGSPKRTRASSATREYTRLLMWEALETDPDHPVNASLRREFFAGWVEAVEEEQRAGKLPADLDPAQLVLSELCLTLGPFLLPQLAQLVTGMSVKDPEFLARREEFLRALGPRLSEPAATART